MPFVVGGTRREVIPVFEKYLNDNKYDIVHIHSGSISILAYYARVSSKKGVKKVIVHSHSSGQKENIKHFLMKIYAAGLFKKYATDFCACSLEAAKWKFTRNVLNRVRILNNGIDLEIFKFDATTRKAMRTSLELDDGTLVLGHVGRFTYEKNQIFLVDVLKEYIKKYPSQKVCLILVGDGPELVNVKKIAEDLRMVDYIKFIGAVDNPSEYLQAMDIFLFPSLYEGLGIVGIEAQAVGLPVIASIGVPKDMKACENVVFLNLISTTWVSTISEYKYEDKTDNFKCIKNKGYDISDTAKCVLNLYINS